MTGARTRGETLPGLLIRNAQERGDQPAIREKRRGIWSAISWHALAADVAALAAGLRARGVTHGSHVAFVGDNRARLPVGILAVQSLGAVAMPLFQDASAEDLAVPIRAAGATHAFAEDQEQVDKLLSILPECPSLGCIIYDNGQGLHHYTQSALVGQADLLSQGRGIVGDGFESLETEVARLSGGDAAFLFQTAGTGGAPRGVLHTHASLIDRARSGATAERLTPADVTLACLPPAWACQTLIGLVQPLVVGHSVCCPESSDTLLEDLRETAPTVLLATPRLLDAILARTETRIEETGGFNRRLYLRAMATARRIVEARLAGRAPSASDVMAARLYEFLLYAPLRDSLGMSRIRAAYSAGDAADPGMIVDYRALGINLKQLYGSTETGFFVAMHRDGAVDPDTVGTPLEGAEVRLSEGGEIEVRSQGLFSGYPADPEATARAMTPDGWYRTGDMGEFGPNGQLRVVERMDDFGHFADGRPFAPRQIESRLKTFAHIRDAVVFGAGRDWACALVDIETTSVGRWADTQEIPYTGHADLASREEVYGLIAECIAEVNAGLARDAALAGSQIRRFVLLPSELSAADGLLTHTGKVRRAAVAGRYAALLEAAFNGLAAFGQASATSEAGGIHDASVAQDIRIGDVSDPAAGRTRRAA